MAQEEVERALVMVQVTQTAFWNALAALEGLTGYDLDGTADYDVVTVENLAQFSQ